MPLLQLYEDGSVEDVMEDIKRGGTATQRHAEFVKAQKEYQSAIRSLKDRHPTGKAFLEFLTELGFAVDGIVLEGEDEEDLQTEVRNEYSQRSIVYTQYEQVSIHKEVNVCFKRE